MHIALTLNAQRHYAEAAQQAQQALERAETLRVQGLKIESLNALAEAALGSGDIIRATAYAQEAATLAEAIGSKRDVGIARRLLGQAAAARSEPFAELFENSITQLEAIRDRFEIARTWAAYGMSLLANRNQIAGLAYLKQARNTFLEIGANGELQRLPPDEERNV